MKTFEKCPNCHYDFSTNTDFKVYVCEDCRDVYCSSCPGSDGGAHCPFCDGTDREELKTLRGISDDFIVIKEPNSFTAIMTEESVNISHSLENNRKLPLEELILIMAISDAGYAYEDLELVLKFPGLYKIRHLNKGADSPDISVPDHKSWNVPCYQVEVNGNKQIWDLVLAGHNWANNDGASCQKKLKQIFGSPYLTPNIKADALALVGCSSADSGLKNVEVNQLRESISFFEEAFKLAKAEGWALRNVTDDGIYADRFADCLFELIGALLRERNHSEIDSLMAKEKKLIEEYRTNKHFRTVHHEGLLLLNEGIKLSDTDLKEGRIEAMNKYKQLVATPYAEFFIQERSPYIVGIAYRNMGLIHFENKDERTAIKMFQTALEYFDPDSEDAIQLRRAMGAKS